MKFLKSCSKKSNLKYFKKFQMSSKFINQQSVNHFIQGKVFNSICKIDNFSDVNIIKDQMNIRKVLQKIDG